MLQIKPEKNISQNFSEGQQTKGDMPHIDVSVAVKKKPRVWTFFLLLRPTMNTEFTVLASRDKMLDEISEAGLQTHRGHEEESVFTHL